MIKTLLMVSSIVGGIGATSVPLNNTEKAQRATLQENSTSESTTMIPYEIDAYITKKQQINTQWYEVPQYSDYYYEWAEQIQEIRYKYWGIQQTQQLLINAGYYDAVKVANNGRETFFDMKLGSQNYDDNSSRIYLVRIDPYTTLTDTEISLRFTLENDFSSRIGEIQPSNVLYNSNINMQYQINAFKTTNTYINQWLDITMTNGINPKDLYYDIRDHSQWYTEYAAQWTARTIATIRNGTINNIQGSKTITINAQMPNETYYMAILIQRRLTAVNVNETEEIITSPSNNYKIQDRLGTEENGFVFWQYDYNEDLKISGYYTPAPVMEVVDIPGMMFDILGMPFMFISTAFNLTLFPGTPYAINFSNLFLVVFGTLVFVFVIRKFLGK